MRTFLPHDRQADTLPTSFGLADAGKVFPGCVQVGVNLTSARSAPKQGLRRTVAPMPVTTLAAILAGAPGIDGDHNGARRLSLVGERAAKPGIAPSVLPTTLAWLLGAGADLGQVLEPRSRWAAPRCRQFAWRERGRNPRRRPCSFFRCRSAEFVFLDRSSRPSRKHRCSISFHFRCPRNRAVDVAAG
jgi:hypothetical protein